MRIERVEDWKEMLGLERAITGLGGYEKRKEHMRSRLNSRASKGTRMCHNDMVNNMKRGRRVLPRFLPRHNRLQFR